MIRFIFQFFYFFPLFLFSQWMDNFSDGNHTANPQWLGQIDSFIVENQQLRLMAPAHSGSSFLSLPSTGVIAGYWECKVNLDFNPSQSNKIKIFVMSDSINPHKAKNAYYIQLGGTNDDVSLYCIKNGVETKIIDGQDNAFNQNYVEVKIRLERSNLGFFALFFDTLTGYHIVGDTQHLDVLSSSYFSILCDYTATRSTLFWFDDVEVTSQTYLDSFPPSLLSDSVASLNSIILKFSEELDTISALNSSHYLLNQIHHPSTISIDKKTLYLEFDTSFNIYSSNHIQLSFKDKNTNISDTSYDFYLEDYLFWKNIMFSEIMADESPSYGLPEYEYIELYNKSNQTVPLLFCSLADARDTVLIPFDTLAAHAYLILCKTTAESAFDTLGDALGVPNFISINNAEEDLYLINKYGVCVDSLNYSKTMYNDEKDAQGNEKENGGYSIERFLSYNVCENESLWRASKSANGGTPGQINTIYIQDIKIDSMYIDSIFIESPKQISVWLNKFVFSVKKENIQLKFLDESLEVDSVFVNTKKVSIWLKQEINEYEKHELTINSLQTCFFNTYETPIQYSFYKPFPLQREDLVINEVLFDSFSGEAEFIECYNKTQHAIDLSGACLYFYSPSHPSIVIDSFQLKRVIIPPNGYVVFTSEKASILKTYTVLQEKQVVEQEMARLNDEEGIIVLKTAEKETVDSIFYSEEMQNTLIDNIEGVSLERINPLLSSTNWSNWQSAAETYGYATPTAKNSQLYTLSQEDNFYVSPEVFSPDNDGFLDFCQILYTPKEKGERCTIEIFNEKGQKIKTLTQNESVGVRNTWKWDGSNEQLQKAQIGMYIIRLQRFNSQGKLRSKRATVVLGAKLK